MQMGDVTNNDGSGGRSVFDSVDGMFEDENFFLQHTQPGIIACANWGRPNTNNSQFYVCLADDAPWLDGKSVVLPMRPVGAHSSQAICNMPQLWRRPAQDARRCRPRRWRCLGRWRRKAGVHRGDDWHGCRRSFLSHGGGRHRLHVCVPVPRAGAFATHAQRGSKLRRERSVRI